MIICAGEHPDSAKTSRQAVDNPWLVVLINAFSALTHPAELSLLPPLWHLVHMELHPQKGSVPAYR